MQFDVLGARTMRPRPLKLMKLLANSGADRGIDVRFMQNYEPRDGSVLITYGLGGHDRLPHAQAHASRGLNYIAFDAGYWERKTEDRRYRVSINGFHCPKLIMRGPNPGPYRWAQSDLSITDLFHPSGDIILVGNSPKAEAVGAAGWTSKKSRELRAAFGSKRRVIYRPKRRQYEKNIICDGVASEGDIEKVLSKASLVVCRHSNVAVDACRAGVPVLCDDGAAAAIYPSKLQDEDKQPSAATRAEFLHRLAWWQWSESEIESGTVWPWLIGQLQ